MPALRLLYGCSTLHPPQTRATVSLMRKAVIRAYEWRPDGCQQESESDVATHVLISAQDSSGNPTYQALENWGDFCIRHP